jgi:predicted RNA-binding Zn-ribbon protein involved in translation (DUF1610 family)
MTTIWEARKAGWTVSLKCHRQREGLKSVRPCAGELKVHLSTLVSSLGPDVTLEELQKRLRCPACGTDRIEVQVSHPPRAEAGANDTKAPRRRMRQMKTGETNLGSSREPWVIFQCDKCGRRGEYKRATLIEEFGNTIDYPSLLETFAHARGCGLARPEAGPYDADRMWGRQCLIRYDVE